jgi:hypothetical protein
LLNEVFRAEKGNGQIISELLLLGNMYCASTPLIRAQRFFEVCQEELPDQISNNDRELTKYIKKQLEIAYPMMLKVYKSLRKPEDPNIQDGWLINDED